MVVKLGKVHHLRGTSIWSFTKRLHEVSSLCVRQGRSTRIEEVGRKNLTLERKVNPRTETTCIKNTSSKWSAAGVKMGY